MRKVDLLFFSRVKTSEKKYANQFFKPKCADFLKNKTKNNQKFSFLAQYVPGIQL